MLQLQGKRALIIGVANDRSLAWSIAEDLKKQGCELAFSFLNEKLEKRVRPLAESVEAKYIAELDVGNDSSIQSFFDGLKNHWQEFDILVHSVAYAEREDLEGRFIDTSRSGFITAMDTSAYSLVKLSQMSEVFMRNNGGSIITLSYLGAVRVIPNYNVMGVAKAALEACVRYLANDLGPQKIRVNAISAGPVKTLSAAGIRDFRTMLSSAAEKVPLRENIDGADVGALASFLASPVAKHITGSVMYVDSGANIL